MLALIMTIADPVKRDMVAELYLTYQENFVSYAAAILHNIHAAEDVVQDVFKKIVEKPNMLKYDVACENRAYVQIMVRNRCYNYHDKEKRSIPHENVNAEEHIDFADDFITLELYSEALETIMNLPPQYRDVLMMRYRFGLSDDEIREVLQISPDNTRMRIHRALAALKQEMKVDDKYA